MTRRKYSKKFKLEILKQHTEEGKSFYQLEKENGISFGQIGKFDGLHLGHRLILNKVISLKETGSNLVIFTFDDNPANYGSNNRIKRIVTKKELLARRLNPEIDYTVIYPFTNEIKNMTPESFVCEILINKLGVKAVVAGSDFCFGKDRQGDCNTLKELGDKYGFHAAVIEKLTYEGREISSNWIREENAAGNLEKANYLLGRPYSFLGNVSHGRKEGTELGFPTLNFTVSEDKIIPPFGVYATKILFY